MIHDSADETVAHLINIRACGGVPTEYVFDIGGPVESQPAYVSRCIVCS